MHRIVRIVIYLSDRGRRGDMITCTSIKLIFRTIASSIAATIIVSRIFGHANLHVFGFLDYARHSSCDLGLWILILRVPRAHIYAINLTPLIDQYNLRISH